MHAHGSLLNVITCCLFTYTFSPCPPAPLMMYLGTCTAIPTAPSPPRMLTTTGAPTGSTVELNWLPPLHPNRAIHYEIEYEPAMTPGDPVNAGSSSSPYFTLTLPNEFLTYNVTVAAVNTQGKQQVVSFPCVQGRTEREVCIYIMTHSYTLAPYCLECHMHTFVVMQSPSTGPQPPTGLTVVVTVDGTAVVSWQAQQSRVCDAVIGNYSVRYQLTGCTCGIITVYTSSTSVTLQGLARVAEYTVSVAAINSIGSMSAHSAETMLNIRGNI